MNKVSYSLGVNIASDLIKQGFEIADMDSFLEGLKAVIENKEFEIEIQEMNTVLQQAQQEAVDKRKSVNKEAGEKFLVENAKRDSVKVTDSGLQYEVIKEGEGAKPKATDKVKVHYHGLLPDGTVFDSSVQRNQPASFPVNGVIPGWVEALQMMSTGSKWRLAIPSDLAYGENGAGNIIGPDQMLLFEVELLEIIEN